MTAVGAAIGAHGFRRWYERQLVESFAYLTTGVLSLIMMAIAIEMLEFRATAAGLLALVAIAAAGGGLCVFSWRRFHRLLARAEYLAEKATCGNCNAYGRFTWFRRANSPDARRLLDRRALPRLRQRVDDRVIVARRSASDGLRQPTWRRRNSSVRSRASFADGAS